MGVQTAFQRMDNSKSGFLSLRDFHESFASLFDLAIKNDEIRALFNEIDSDEDGIIKYKEFEAFYDENYAKRLALALLVSIENEGHAVTTTKLHL